MDFLIRSAFKDALQEWQNIIPLTFYETDGHPDIEIKFEKRYHGDNDAFDGPGIYIFYICFYFSI